MCTSFIAMGWVPISIATQRVSLWAIISVFALNVPSPLSLESGHPFGQNEGPERTKSDIPPADELPILPYSSSLN